MFENLQIDRKKMIDDARSTMLGIYKKYGVINYEQLPADVRNTLNREMSNKGLKSSEILKIIEPLHNPSAISNTSSDKPNPLNKINQMMTTVGQNISNIKVGEKSFGDRIPYIKNNPKTIGYSASVSGILGAIALIMIILRRK